MQAVERHQVASEASILARHLVYCAAYEIGGENYFAAMMAFAARHRIREWREKLAAAAQPEISPETYLYARVLSEKGKYENQSEKQVGKNLRRRRQFSLHFLSVCVKTIVAAIEADDTAFVVTT